METSLVWAAIGNHVDVQGLRRTGPAPHWLQCSGELAPSLTVELLLVAGVWVNQHQEHEYGRVGSATHLARGGLGCEGDAPLYHLQQSGELRGHESR